MLPSLLSPAMHSSEFQKHIFSVPLLTERIIRLDNLHAGTKKGKDWEIFSLSSCPALSTPSCFVKCVMVTPKETCFYQSLTPRDIDTFPGLNPAYFPSETTSRKCCPISKCWSPFSAHSPCLQISLSANRDLSPHTPFTAPTELIFQAPWFYSLWEI